MDERIKGIKEGAGREESRINEDLLEFLQKWSTPALLVLAAVAVSYWGWNQYKQMQVAKVNKAAAAYTSATVGGAANPDTLSNIAEEFSGVRSFGLLAKLDLADVYLFAVQRGLAPGVEYDPNSQLAEGDLLDDAAQTMYLDRAKKLYQEVYDAAATVKGKEPLAIEAAFGLAAAAETADDLDGARTQLGKAKALADKIGYQALAIIADKRAASFADAGPKPKLYAAAALPPLPEPEPVAPPPGAEGSDQTTPPPAEGDLPGTTEDTTAPEGSGTSETPDQTTPPEDTPPDTTGGDTGSGG